MIALLARREREGLSLRELSAKTGIAAGTLSWWSWRLRHDAQEERKEADHGFVELVATPEHNGCPVTIELRNGIRLEVEDRVDADALRKLVDMLGGAVGEGQAMRGRGRLLPARRGGGAGVGSEPARTAVPVCGSTGAGREPTVAAAGREGVLRAEAPLEGRLYFTLRLIKSLCTFGFSGASSLRSPSRLGHLVCRRQLEQVLVVAAAALRPQATCLMPASDGLRADIEVVRHFSSGDQASCE